MDIHFILKSVFMMCFATVMVQCEYHTEVTYSSQMKEKVTQVHFYFHDIHSGNHPSAVLVAQAKDTTRGDPAAPFGSVFVIDNLLTEGPEPTSKVTGNAQGIYASTGSDKISLVTYVDFGFTTGAYSGSSFSVFSRNLVAEGDRELVVIGGRGQFRMARGFAQLKNHFLNTTNGDGIIEYNVTLFHL